MYKKKVLTHSMLKFCKRFHLYVCVWGTLFCDSDGFYKKGTNTVDLAFLAAKSSFIFFTFFSEPVKL